ncbi:MAG: hypothetical protein QW507_00390 [Candidatus Nanoarchaeia archaeon]|nr:hypothetical protein [Candidatus Haiyanarchaeum thermophilum]MCW1302960.1 hypothetical protein [Candidatus Haiyanarchaeum thermophilum]MCW1303638.1 hypothetical protein [Candidatus Haiyanarchaeum thermophilum]MCW1306319.1 hypothetical protein [Candidatus Haiyanarchaeum thermophilum]MCW1307171.1 hypothetical protein [Candidatus Haiyanarchaeum thermophilum]
MKILLDSNFIIFAIKHRLNLYDRISEVVPEGFEFILLKDCDEEIRKVFKREIDELLKSWRVKIVEFEFPGSVDEKILQYAKLNQCAVATLDAKLRRKAAKQKLHIIYLHDYRVEFR